MCDPVSITTAVVAVVGAAMQQRQARAQAGAVEDQAEYNARVSENEAVKARNLATEQENDHRLKVARLAAAQRAQLGAAGVDLGSGSALQLQEDTQSLGEADALRIRQSGTSRVEALQTQAGLTRAEGATRAFQIKSQGRANAAGTLLGGASGAIGGVASKWFKPNSAAVVSGARSGSGVSPTSPSFNEVFG